MSKKLWRVLIPAVLLIVSIVMPVSADKPAQAPPDPVFLRLKYATFDPLAGEPEIPASLTASRFPADERVPQIVQFRGPVEDSWKAEVTAAGGEVLDYLPDYAFIVRMDAAAAERVRALSAVRWVGAFQPAYKLSPTMDPNKHMYVVETLAGADLARLSERLKSINAPTTEVAGEIFGLMLPDGGIEAVAAWPEVQWIEEFVMYKLDNNVATGIMGGAQAWTNGYHGAGQTVTVADTGVDSGTDNPATVGDIHADFDNRLAHIASWPVRDPLGGGCVANVGADDNARDRESGHGTHVLGSVAGNGSASGGTIKGLGYQANLTFQALEQYVTFTPACKGAPYYYTDGYYLMGIPADLTQLFLQAYNWGSRIHSNSWGSSVAGQYTVNSQTVDRFIWDHPDMTILFSAGNSGTDANADGYVDQDSIGSPATAKNCITSGASENERSAGGYNPGGPCSTWGTCWPQDFPANPTRDDRLSDTREEMAAFSSRGPTDDGRIKPDVVAPGSNILSTRSHYATENGWGAYDANYEYMGGTSMSNPLIAGAATLVREYYVKTRNQPAPSAALIKATMINSAVDIAGYGNAAQEAGLKIPNVHEGWGRVNVGAATAGTRMFRDKETLATGGNKTYTFAVGNSSVPLKVTLAWSDYPGSPTAGGLVNNLNLVVTSPSSTTYLGNRFSGGWSTTGGTADSKNNVESVYIQNPAQGTWTIRVNGANVAQGPQPFAVVITGSQPAAGPPQSWLPLIVKQFPLPAPTATPRPTATPPGGGWTNILSDGFEGTFPGAWQLVSQGSSGDYRWAKRNCQKAAGSYSAWGIGGGTNGTPLACGATYPANVDSWMIRGPFSLTGATAAQVQYKIWLNSEQGYDGVCILASTNGTNFDGECWSGNSQGWVSQTLDMADPAGVNVVGQPQVWVAFNFSSDSSNQLPNGGFVDDVLIRKCSGSCAGAPAAQAVPDTLVGRPATRTLPRP